MASTGAGCARSASVSVGAGCAQCGLRPQCECECGCGLRPVRAAPAVRVCVRVMMASSGDAGLLIFHCSYA